MSLFGKRKHVGRHVPGQWVIGGIERHTGECFFQTVLRRDAGTFIPVIQVNVLPGTIIMTDQWLAYQTLPNFNYNHHTVNHRKHFVNLRNRQVHTQNIESLWNAAKDKFRHMHGTRTHLLQSYLDKFAWRSQYGMFTGTAFHNILTHIAMQYPV